MKKKKAPNAAKSLKARLVRQLTSYNASRHLSAYQADRSRYHIAMAWQTFRKARVAPSKVLLGYIDSLCNEILRSEKPRRKNAVRDAEIQRLADAQLNGNRLDYQTIARSKGVSVDVVKQIRSRRR